MNLKSTQLTDIFIRRPVFATVLSLVIVLIGLRAYFDLPIRLFPEIETSVISVSVNYPGASAKLMEGFVAGPIESVLGGVEGLDYMKSSSTQGSADITLHFRLGYNMNQAMTDVSSQLASVRRKLPKGINDPTIHKHDPNTQPMIYLSFSSNKMSAQAVTDYLLRVVQPQLETVKGVGQARIFGNRVYAMRIWLNPKLMAAHQVTADDVAKALQENNLQIAAGRIESDETELNITAKTDLGSAKQFNNLVIRDDNNHLVRLKNIGYAKLGSADQRVSVIMNGRNTVGMGIIPLSDANPLNVSKRIKKILPDLQDQMPSDLKVTMIRDNALFIQSSIYEVFRTILEATLFVVAVIFLFLGSFRAVLIPVVTIPLSLIGVCGLMLMLGYSLNTLTLLAWVLAIGLVVDDSIVVLENIHRHIEDGKPPVAAALQGGREIGFAVIAMTLTLAAVYAPIGFLTGLTGSLFREFAFTLAGAVIISGFIALTLSPMMCSKLLKRQPHNSDNNRQTLAYRIDKILSKIMKFYKALLIKMLNMRWIVILVALVIYASCYFLYSVIPGELAPKEDPGSFMVSVTAPSSANLKYTEKYTNKLRKIYAGIPELTNYGIINGIPDGVNSAISFAVLKPWSERIRSAKEIVDAIDPKIAAIPGVKAFPFIPSSLPGSSGYRPVQFIIKTTGNYYQLDSAVKNLLDEIKNNPKLTHAQSDLTFDKPQVDINIDRNKASILGISMASIGNTLNTLLGEPTTGQFVINGRSYDVIPELMPEFRNNPHKLNNINVRTRSQTLVPLSNLVTIKESVGPNSLSHFQQQRAAKITAGLAPGYTLGEALDYLKTTALNVLPDNTQFDYSGESRRFLEASGAMLVTFGFALIFIFLVLSAQFESFRNPFIVMLSVPLSIGGALLTLYLTNSSMNIYTQIGLVTLIGLITKHGILMVEFANQLQEQGRDIYQAIIESASIRLRPILMTTAAMVLGAIPLAITTGAGAEARQQLGWTIVGGMSIGTLFTLFVVPAAYTLLAKRQKAFSTGDVELDKEQTPKLDCFVASSSQ